MDEAAVTKINDHTTAEHVATRALFDSALAKAHSEPPLLTVDVDEETGAHAKFNVDKLTPRQRMDFVIAAGVGSSMLVRLLDWIGSHLH